MDLMMKKDLRDEFAMSMNNESVPKINDKETMIEISKLYNIDFDFDDQLSLIDFAVQYEAAIRYKYADAMIKYKNTLL